MKKFFPFILSGLVFFTGLFSFFVLKTPSPGQVINDYLKARYTNNTKILYDLTSALDQRYRTFEEFKQLNPSPSYVIQETLKELARLITIEKLELDIQGDYATVVVEGVVPNARNPEIYDIIHGQLLSESNQIRKRKLEIRIKAIKGELTFLKFEETIDLVLEGGYWKVYLDWAHAYSVQFTAEKEENLVLDFSVSPEVITLKPGETGKVIYRVFNPSNYDINIKAGHFYEPEESKLYINLLECFCFYEDTLKAGETKEMPVVFRLDWNIPIELTDLLIRYRYYSTNNFPEKL